MLLPTRFEMASTTPDLVLITDWLTKLPDQLPLAPWWNKWLGDQVPFAIKVESWVVFLLGYVDDRHNHAGLGWLDIIEDVGAIIKKFLHAFTRIAGVELADKHTSNTLLE